MQILRGLAAVLVVLHHFNQMLPWPNVGLVLFGYDGDSGVDIFFLISGFVMVRSTEKPEHARPGAFVVRRFFRVVPLAEICTLLYFLLLWGKPTLNVLLRSLCFIPLLPSDPPKFGWSLVPQMWTLSYEIVFYALFGLALIFCHRRRVAVVIGLIFSSIFLFQFLLGGPFSWRPDGVHLPTAHDGILPVEVMGVLGNPILLEFVAGILLAWGYGKWEALLRQPECRLPLRLTAIVLLGAFLAIYFSPYEAGHGLLNKHGYGSVCLVTAALLLELSLAQQPANQPTGPLLRICLWLGAISYPLYLVHLGIVGSIVGLLPTAAVRALSTGLLGFVVFIAVSIGLAALLHTVVERPFLNWGKRLIGDRVPSA